MSSDEAFCLKWNDFQDSISSSLGELYQASDLQDVTLQCGQESLQCHRLVLAACSTWFRQIFKTLNSSNRHPVIVLWETAARDMGLLLDFMYNGVVNVKQENLNSFLALAERLSVRGLSQNDSENNKSSVPHSASSSQSTSQNSQKVSTNRVSSAPAQSLQVEDVNEVDLGVNIVKQEHVKEDYQLEQDAYDDNYYEEPDNYEEPGTVAMNVDQSSGMLNNKERGTNRGYCIICDRYYGNLYQHNEDKHNVNKQRIPCPFCPKTFASVNSMRVHKSLNHRKSLNL